MANMWTPTDHLGDRPSTPTFGQAKATARQKRRMEHTPVSKRDRGLPAGFNGQSFQLFEAITTSTIANARGLVWGFGTVQLYFFDPENPETLVADMNGEDGKGNTNVRNWYTVQVPLGKHCFVFQAAGGWRIFIWDC